MVRTDAGEDFVVSCKCGYAANLERASSRIAPIVDQPADARPARGSHAGPEDDRRNRRLSQGLPCTSDQVAGLHGRRPAASVPRARRSSVERIQGLGGVGDHAGAHRTPRGDSQRLRGGCGQPGTGGRKHMPIFADVELKGPPEPDLRRQQERQPPPGSHAGRAFRGGLGGPAHDRKRGRLRPVRHTLWTCTERRKSGTSSSSASSIPRAWER